MPSLFAFGDQVVGRPQYMVFAAFGAFALIGIVEFGGPLVNRLRSQVTLAACGAFMVVVGTLASQSTWAAVPVMAAGSFVVLFAGVVSSQIAQASTSVLLPLIVATSLPATAGQLPDRLAGFGSAALVSLVALAVLWPVPTVDPLRRPTIAALRSLARRLGDGRLDASDPAAVADLGRAFLATPFRPTGLSTQTRLNVRLVEELAWLDRAIRRRRPEVVETALDAVAADALGACADGLEQRADRGRIAPALGELRTRLRSSERSAEADERDGVTPEAFVHRLKPGFRAQELAFAVGSIGETVQATLAAEGRSWWAALLGRQTMPGESLMTAGQRARAHLGPSSVWFRNSVRGAVALGLATLVADEVRVQHSFWVVFGTLSVLRSNAFSTGQFITRAIAGTVAGFLVGAAVISLVGTNTGLLWAILPLSVLIGGLAPALVSFTVGQAAFTVTILVLFTIIAPEGLHLGVVRVEDVLLGCGVSLAVALVFWPRGAGAHLRAAIGDAYALAGQYLSDAVDFASACCTQGDAPPAPPLRESELAIAAARRLDDAFRTYLAERGAKPAPLPEITNLLTGSAVLRLTADAVLALWRGADPPVPGTETEVRTQLVAKASRIRSWFDELAQSLARGGEIHEPLVVDPESRSAFFGALRDDLATHDGRGATTVRLVWTELHVTAAIDVQRSIVDSARLVVRPRVHVAAPGTTRPAACVP